MTTSGVREYSSYKDSGVEWLGAIPQHWRLLRIKNLTETKSGTTPRSDNDDYYDNGTYFWIRTTDLNNNRLYGSEFKVTDLAVMHHGLATIPIGSVLLAMYGGMGTIGKNALLQAEAVINQSVCAILPNDKAFNAVYLWYFFQYFRPRWELFANSARKDPNISQEVIKRLWITLPPLPEQQAIAAYLDAKTAQIDRKIDLLTQKAAKYRQLKQSLINEAVTRGLDKSAPMKDSGIKWIGEVPAHWRIVRLKDVAELRYSNVDKLSKEDEVSVALCNYVDVYKNDFIDASLPFMTATAGAAEIKRFSLRQHDVLVTKDSETADDIAVPALVLETLPGALCGYHLAQLRSRNEVMYGPYLFRLFQADNYGHRFATHAKGITRVGLSMSAFADALTPVPPYDEQMAISKHIDAKAAEIDDIAAIMGHQIDRLKELRKSLINEVVTGKLRVI